jgi:protein-tyrosine phosphatase
MLEELLYRVRLRGVRVTLAHPERSRVFQREPHRLVALREQGVLFQVNADTLLAGGSVARRLVEHLCRNGMAQALASDGHRASGRRPVTALPTAVHVLGELVGEERALWMARDVPAAIIDGRPLPPAPEISTPRWRFSARIRRGRPAP